MTDEKENEQVGSGGEESNQSHQGGQATRIGAQGFGLNAKQQEAIADLWRWEKDSLESDIVLGGPLSERYC